MDGGHSESNRGSFFQRVRSWLKYRGSFFQRVRSRWGYRGSFFQRLYRPAAGARMWKDSGGANECAPLMEESGGAPDSSAVSLALFEHFLDRVLVEAQIVGDLEEVDLLRGADDVVDLHDSN